MRRSVLKIRIILDCLSERNTVLWMLLTKQLLDIHPKNVPEQWVKHVT
jgi:hypothetical protein